MNEQGDEGITENFVLFGKKHFSCSASEEKNEVGQISVNRQHYKNTVAINEREMIK
jgi:hypothetical protein